MFDVRARWLMVAALAVLTAGCAALVGDRGLEAPDPIERVPAADCPAQARDAGAWTWRVDLQRTGVLPCASVPDQVDLAFSIAGVNVGDHTAAKSSPVAVDGAWLVAGDTGKLSRVTQTGRFAWTSATHPSAYGIHGTPAVQGGVAYVGAYDGALYAFDLETGDALWRTRLGGSIGASPLVYQGEVYVAVETPEPSGLVSIVNATTGQEVWRDERVTDHPHSSIALDPAAGVFVVGANDGNLYAWNLATREHAWTLETGGPVKGPVAIHDGAAFAGSWDDRLYRVNLSTGDVAWTYETGGNVMSGPAVDARTGTVYVSSLGGSVHAVDADTGRTRWVRGIGPSMSSPVVAGHTLLVGSYDEHLYALDAGDGSLAWRFEAGGRVTGTAAVLGERVAFTERANDASGRLYVLEPTGS